MTDQQQKQNQQNELALRKDENQSIIIKRARELATRLKYMIVNGNRLSDPEIYALAQYAAATDLNPFAQECYYLPGTGPIPGIAGWRKKGQEQLEYEANQISWKSPASFWTVTRPANLSEANFDPSKGDIAIHVELHDTLTRQGWLNDYLRVAKELCQMGMHLSEAADMAKALIGPEPVKTAVGVVYASEKFAKDDKPEKFDRYERAEKRAEKLAIRKRFPRVNLPEPDGANEEFVNVEFSSVNAPPKSEAQLLSELGFDNEPPKKIESQSE